MAAAHESKRLGGAPVAVDDVIAAAVQQAQVIVETQWHTPGTMKAATAAGTWSGNAPAVVALWPQCGGDE